MSAPTRQLRFAFLDIGLGDSTVITWDDRTEGASRPRRRCVVVDGGKTIGAAERLANYLIEQEVNRIDLLVVTHIDWDHLGGITQLMNRTGLSNPPAPFDQLVDLQVTTYWGPLPRRPGSHGTRLTNAAATEAASEFRAYITSERQNQDLLEALAGRVDEFVFPARDAMPKLDLFNNLELDLLAPGEQRFSNEYRRFRPSTFDTLSIDSPIEALSLEELNAAIGELAEARAEQAATSANNQSIVFSATPTGLYSRHSGKRLFLTGDAEDESWTELDALPQSSSRLRARYFKVPHHGASSGLGRGWEKVRPRVSVLSVGQANYGHPHLDVLRRLRSMSRNRIYCTQRNQYDSRYPGNHGDGNGGTGGYCKLLGAECPKHFERDFGHLIVTLTPSRETIRMAGDYCPIDWEQVTPA